MRADLPRGVQAAQLVHAAGESTPRRLPKGTFAVVLAVPDASTLLDVAERLALAGVPHVRIEEPDAPYLGALMAIGCVPARKEEIGRHLASLPLLK